MINPIKTPYLNTPTFHLFDGRESGRGGRVGECPPGRACDHQPSVGAPESGDKAIGRSGKGKGKEVGGQGKGVGGKAVGGQGKGVGGHGKAVSHRP